MTITGDFFVVLAVAFCFPAVFWSLARSLADSLARPLLNPSEKPTKMPMKRSETNQTSNPARQKSETFFQSSFVYCSECVPEIVMSLILGMSAMLILFGIVLSHVQMYLFLIFFIELFYIYKNLRLKKWLKN